MQTADGLDEYILRILDKGVQKAAAALFDFTSEEVCPDSARYFPAPDPALQPPAQFHVLETRLIGDLRGSCYLTFNAVELEYMVERLGKQYSINDDELMTDCLVEMMNIIGSPITTELSNALQLKVFLDVPVLRQMSPSDDCFVPGEQSDGPLWFRSVLQSRSSVDFSPELICKILPDTLAPASVSCQSALR